jgi:hypothetical protein
MLLHSNAVNILHLPFFVIVLEHTEDAIPLVVDWSLNKIQRIDQ